MPQATETSQTPEQITLAVYQQAIAALLNWANIELPENCSYDSYACLEQAQTLLGWNPGNITNLQLIFDLIHLQHNPSVIHYVPMQPIADTDPQIPYPSTSPPSQEQLATFKQTLRQDLAPYLAANWQSLSWLMVALDKYGSCLGCGDGAVALVDLSRIISAIAVAIDKSHDPQKFCLIAGDLSGIQKFIYTIASSGALKSLRARSFYLELVTEEIVQQLLTDLDLTRSSVIYAGGGNLYLLAPQGLAHQASKTAERVNIWLQKEFQGKIFLSLACQDFNREAVSSDELTHAWNQVITQVNQQKTYRFSQQLSQILQPRPSYLPCKVCHRDNQRTLNLLNPQEADSPDACTTCQRMFRLGGQLFQVSAIVRSHVSHMPEALDRLRIALSGRAVYYHLFKQIPQKVNPGDTIFLINNWRLADYQRILSNASIQVFPLLLGKYGAKGQEGFMTAQEFAAHSSIGRVGYLRMDVDRLGQIFAKGLGENYSLPKLAGLSRQMSYFFKVYLNSLAEDRHANFENCSSEFQFKLFSDKPRQELLFIYAGGDDLFVSGAWNQVVEFAFDTYQSFRAYTGNHPDITLSGGISLETPKFPLYQAAGTAGAAEEEAKSNDRDSLGLFEQVFKWREWLGTISLEELEKSTGGYLSSRDRPEAIPFLGIWEFVTLFQDQLSSSANRSFVRNLLLTAQIQEQHIIQKQQVIERHRAMLLNQSDNSKIDRLQQEVNDLRYYLHLPKLAYALARLPTTLRDKQEFRPMRISLLSPYNAPYFRAIATWLELLNRRSSDTIDSIN